MMDLTALTTRFYVAAKREALRAWAAEHRQALLAIAWAFAIMCLVIL